MMMMIIGPVLLYRESVLKVHDHPLGHFGVDLNFTFTIKGFWPTHWTWYETSRLWKKPKSYILYIIMCITLHIVLLFYIIHITYYNSYYNIFPFFIGWKFPTNKSLRTHTHTHSHINWKELLKKMKKLFRYSLPGFKQHELDDANCPRPFLVIGYDTEVMTRPQFIYRIRFLRVSIIFTCHNFFFL